MATTNADLYHLLKKHWLRRLWDRLRPAKPLSLDDRLRVFAAMQQRLYDRSEGREPESISEMLIRLELK